MLINFFFKVLTLKTSFKFSIKCSHFGTQTGICRLLYELYSQPRREYDPRHSGMPDKTQSRRFLLQAE